MTAWDLLPVIRRARDYRLYDDTTRYLDFYQDDGHAILGHRPGRVRLAMKQQLDRGLLAPYPTIDTKRLERALSALLPDRRGFRWFADPRHGEQLLADYIDGWTPGDDSDHIADPARGESSDRVALWRPWIPNLSLEPKIFVPVVPAPGTSWITFYATADELSDDYFPSDPLSPVIVSAITTSIYALIRAMANTDTAGWQEFDSALWKRRGPYLQLLCDESDFRELFRDFLNHGMMLAPEFRTPSIVPLQYDAGEIKHIRRLEKR